jgi:hypothetical protein
MAGGPGFEPGLTESESDAESAGVSTPETTQTEFQLLPRQDPKRFSRRSLLRLSPHQPLSNLTKEISALVFAAFVSEGCVSRFQAKINLGALWRFLKAWVISMGLQFGTLASWVLAGTALACASVSGATCALAGGDDLDLVCTGNSYQKDGPFPTVETFSVKIAGTKPVMIGQPGSDKPVKARIVANNAIQLKFATGKFTGEYFHFTGDLFLIHTDGRLTRLTCKPS